MSESYGDHALVVPNKTERLSTYKHSKKLSAVQRLSQFVQICSNLFHIIPNYSKLFQIVPNLFRLAYLLEIWSCDFVV